MDIDEKFDLILSKMKDPTFLEDRGLGNDIGYYIFDYDPKCEMQVRYNVKKLIERFNSKDYGYRIIDFDLFDILIDIINKKGYLEKNFELEKNKGKDYAKRSIQMSLKTSKSDLVVDHIKDTIEKNIQDNPIVFILGVGKAYPLIRSHKVLNKLYSQVDNVPMVLFYPGYYSGNELHLFNMIKSNYYNALKLVDVD